ncbi:Beta-glucosidase 16, partial [Bienertia sinuspersici]
GIGTIDIRRLPSSNEEISWKSTTTVQQGRIDCFHYFAECNLGDKQPIRGFVATTGIRDGVLIGDETGNPRFFVVPQGMEKLMNYLTLRYPNTTLYVTENGEQ